MAADGHTADAPQGAPTPAGTATGSSSIVLRLVRQLRTYTRVGWASAALVVASLAAGAAEAGVIMAVIAAAVALASGSGRVDLDVGGLSAGGLDLAEVLLLSAAMVVVLVSGRLIAALVVSRLSGRLLAAARVRLLDRFLGASWEAQSAERETYIHELASVYALRVANTAALLGNAATNALAFLAIAVAALVVDPTTAGILLGVTVVLLLLFRPLIGLTKRRASRHIEAHHAFVDRVADTLGVLPELRIYGVRDVLMDRIRASSDEVAVRYRRMRFVAQAMPGLYLGVTFTVVLTGLGLVRALGVTDFVAVGTVVLFLLRGLRYSQQVQSGWQGAAEVAVYLDGLTQSIDRFQHAAPAAGDRRLGGGVGRLELRAVGYTYPTQEVALTDVDLIVEPGEVLGVAGPSGGGKSTLAQILLGLRTPTTGRYLVDGEAVDEIAPASWFSRVAYVSQQPQLIEGDVVENVRFLREHVDDDAVRRALHAAGLADDLARWAEGSDRQVGVRGSAVSGGQRQRIAIARALAGGPDVLVLDEPTSALDPDAELRIRETLAALRGTVTVIVVAHREATLQVCDRVVTVSAGRLLPGAVAPGSWGAAPETG